MSKTPFVSFVSLVATFFVSFVAPEVIAQAPATTTWDGIYTAEQAKRGAALFTEQCAACHGESLQGVESAPALVGDTFNSTWEGVALSDLFERIRTTMPLTAPGSLSRTQTADVLAFIVQSGKFPAGMKELDPTALGSIKYRTYRP